MRRSVGVSVGAHGLAAVVALLWWLPIPRPDEVPATIQVLFGDNAEVAGARSSPQAVPAVPGTKVAVQPDGETTVAAASAAGGLATGGASLPVRLGDGDIGLKLSEPPDAGMIEAHADPGNRAPKYPEAASLQRQHGRVVIRMHIDTEGRVVEAEVLESSGHPALDRAAREALSRWHFTPALRNGVGVPSFRDQATNFVLE